MPGYSREHQYTTHFYNAYCRHLKRQTFRPAHCRPLPELHWQCLYRWHCPHHYSQQPLPPLWSLRVIYFALSLYRLFRQSLQSHQYCLYYWLLQIISSRHLQVTRQNHKWHLHPAGFYHKWDQRQPWCHFYLQTNKSCPLPAVPVQSQPHRHLSCFLTDQCHSYLSASEPFHPHLYLPVNRNYSIQNF